MSFSLRRCQPSDASAIAQMMGDDAVYPGLLQMPYPSETKWRQTLEGNETQGNPDLVLVAIEDGTGRLLGNAGLHAVGKAIRRRHVMSLGLAVARDAQGQGVGTALLGALIAYADNWSHVLRLELTVYADNAGAIRLYERMGFEQEGRHRGYALRDGRYVDTLSMARLHPKPPQWEERI